MLVDGPYAGAFNVQVLIHHRSYMEQLNDRGVDLTEWQGVGMQNMLERENQVRQLVPGLTAVTGFASDNVQADEDAVAPDANGVIHDAAPPVVEEVHSSDSLVNNPGKEDEDHLADVDADAARPGSFLRNTSVVCFLQPL